MNIISWNVNGIRSAMGKSFEAQMSQLNPDIFCLQETKAQNDEARAALQPFAHYHTYLNSAQRKGYSGTAILSREEPKCYTPDMGIPEHDAEGRVQCAEYEHFYLVNVYVPNSGQKLERLDYRQQWDKDFCNYLRQLEKRKPVIACGDFNVAHRPIDLKNDKANYNKVAGYTQIEIDGMDNLLSQDFVDSFRLLYPEQEVYTYWSYRFRARERNSGWRIDYFLLSKSLVDKIEDVKIYTEIMGSDHCPIGIKLNF